MRVAGSIEWKLRKALAPTRLDIIDESHKHAGHVGARPEGETHFSVEVASAAFAGKSRVDRQRLVYGILAAELEGPVHALALRTVTPDEDRRAD
jgi:BolA protein